MPGALRSFFLLLLAPGPLAVAGETLAAPYVDEFDQSTDWAGENDSWIAKFQDGHLVCENLNSTAGYLNWVARELPLERFRDFEISTRVRMVNGAPQGSAAIIWDAVPDQKKRFFEISTNGTYGIYGFEKGAWFHNRVGVPSPLIRETEDNDLAIRVIDHRAYFFINGVAVDAIDFPGPADPWIGLVTAAGCTNSFDRFEVRYLESTPETRAADTRKYEAEAKASLVAVGPTREDFVEKFDDNRRHWPYLKAADTWTAKIENGELTWENRAKEGKQRTFLSRPINLAADYEIIFRARHAGGESNLLSVIWNANSQNTTGLEFGFSPNGYYLMSVYGPGKFTNLSPWTQSTLIKAKDFNELRVRQLDRTLFFFINGQVVADLPAQNATGDQLGFGISFGMKVAFDELRVTYPKLDRRQIAAEKDQLLATLQANHGKAGLGVVYSAARERDLLSAQAKADLQRLEDERWKLTDADQKELAKVRAQFEGKKMLSLFGSWGRPISISDDGARVYYHYKLVGRTQYYYEFQILKRGDQKEWLIDAVQHRDKRW